MLMYVSIGARFLLATVFLLAALGKLRNKEAFREFSVSLSGLRLLSRRQARWAAVALPTGEVILVVLLLAHPRTVVAGLVLSGALLGVFNVAILLAMRKGVRTSCRCFGASSRQLGWMHVNRNLLLIVVVVAGVVGASSSGAAALPGYLLAGATGAILGLIVTVLDDLMELSVRSR